MDTIIGQVRKVCKDKINRKALALSLGYKSDGTLKAWAKKGKIPSWKMADVKEKLGALTTKPSSL